MTHHLQPCSDNVNNKMAARATTPSSFEQYEPGSVLHGRLGFYIKTLRHNEPYGKLRGPIYQTCFLIGNGCAEIYSTESSCNGLSEGEGYVSEVEIHVVKAGGVFVVKLKGKDAYIIEEDGKLLVAKRLSRNQATRFTLQLTDGMMVPLTPDGLRWYDNGERGWNTSGKGDQLWLQFVSEAERREKCRKNVWGVWQPEQRIRWP
jgi:hypothetical protein